MAHGCFGYAPRSAKTILFFQEFSEFGFVYDFNSELLRLRQLAASVFAREQVSRFLAHAPAHLTAARDDQLRDLIAWLVQRAGDHPRRFRERIARARLRPVVDHLHARVAEPLDQRAIRGFLEESVNALPDDFAD